MTEKKQLSEWVEDWKEQFSTDLTEKDLQSFIGQKVSVRRAADEEMYELSVVGYSKTVISDGENTAEQHSILTGDGRQVMLRTGVELHLVQD